MFDLTIFDSPDVRLMFLNPLIANLTKWSNTLKRFVCNLPTNCLSVFDHFVGLALKGLKYVFNTVTVSLWKSESPVSESPIYLF